MPTAISAHLLFFYRRMAVGQNGKENNWVFLVRVKRIDDDLIPMLSPTCDQTKTAVKLLRGESMGVTKCAGSCLPVTCSLHSGPHIAAAPRVRVCYAMVSLRAWCKSTKYIPTPAWFTGNFGTTPARAAVPACVRSGSTYTRRGAHADI